MQYRALDQERGVLQLEMPEPISAKARFTATTMAFAKEAKRGSQGLVVQSDEQTKIFELQQKEKNRVSGAGSGAPSNLTQANRAKVNERSTIEAAIRAGQSSGTSKHPQSLSWSACPARRQDEVRRKRHSGCRLEGERQVEYKQHG